MKSWNAEVNSERKRARLAVFSRIALMLLVLSTGSTFAADENPEVQLWQYRGVGQKPVALRHITDGELAKADRWLFTNPSEDSFGRFVSDFKSEPFKFVEGFKDAFLKAFDEGKEDTFKRAVEEYSKKLDAKMAGTAYRADALKTLIASMLGKSKDELKKADLLRKLFDDPTLRAQLGLTDKDPSKKPERENTNKNDDEETRRDDERTPSRSPEPPVVDEQLKKQLEEMKTKAEADRKALEDQIKAMQQAQQAAQQAAQQQPRVSPVPSADPTKGLNLGGTQAIQTPRPTGEFDDSALRFQAQQICDKINSRKDDFSDLKNQFAQLASAIEQESRVPPPTNANKANNQLEDLLPGLLADTFKKNDQQQFQPPPQPQIPAQRAQRDRGGDRSPFDTQLPPQPEQTPPPTMPWIPQPYQSTSSQVPVRVDLPTQTGRIELRDAEDMSSYLETRPSIANSLTPQSSLTDLVYAKAKVQTDSQRAKFALQGAKDRLNTLDSQLEELKEGARAALDPNVKREQTRLQSELDTKKRQFEQQQKQLAAQAQAGGLDAQTLGQLNNQLQEQVSAAETALNKYNAEVEIQIENGNRQIKSMAKTRDRLQSAVNKLEGQVGSLKSEEEAVQQLISTNMQMQLAAIQGQGQPQQQGTPNVNKIMSGGGSANRPGSSRLGGLGAASNAGTAGVPARGKLGSSSN